MESIRRTGPWVFRRSDGGSVAPQRAACAALPTAFILLIMLFLGAMPLCIAYASLSCCSWSVHLRNCASWRPSAGAPAAAADPKPPKQETWRGYALRL